MIPYRGEGGNTPIGEKTIQMPTLKQRLDAAVQRAEEQLAAAKEARELLDKNPDLERLIDLMQKGHF